MDGFGNINYDDIEPKVFLDGKYTDGDMQELFLEYIEELENVESSK